MERQVSTSGSMEPLLVCFECGSWEDGDDDDDGGESRRSASSRTTKRTRRRPMVVSSPEVRMWSARRPGVAMTTCGREERASAWARMSDPPLTRMGFRD